MSAFDSELASAVAEVDELPQSRRPALCFVSAQLVAEHAARAGCDEVACGREEQALQAVVRGANALAPSPADADSPNGYARRGAREGIIDAWRGEVHAHELPGSTVADRELYSAAYSLTACATTRTKSEELGR